MSVKLIEPLCRPKPLWDALEEASYWRGRGVQCVIRLAGSSQYVVWSALEQSQDNPDGSQVDKAAQPLPQVTDNARKA
jgi:hypothetical protein